MGLLFFQDGFYHMDIILFDSVLFAQQIFQVLTAWELFGMDHPLAFIPHVSFCFNISFSIKKALFLFLNNKGPENLVRFSGPLFTLDEQEAP